MSPRGRYNYNLGMLIPLLLVCRISALRGSCPPQSLGTGDGQALGGDQGGRHSKAWSLRGTRAQYNWVRPGAISCMSGAGSSGTRDRDRPGCEGACFTKEFHASSVVSWYTFLIFLGWERGAGHSVLPLGHNEVACLWVYGEHLLVIYKVIPS